MPKSNPYTPPSASLESGASEVAGRATLPFLLVLRWIVGVAIVVHGLYALYSLSQSWSDLADRAIIDPGFSPYRYLPAALLKIATGIGMLLRSKWSVLLAIAWTAAFSYPFLSSIRFGNLPSIFLFSVMEQLAILFFLSFLWVKGRLR
jgi:hypothetical protein